MRLEIIEYIQSNNELKQFIREQPMWYRTLCRHPEEIERFEIASLHYYKRTIPHRMEKFSNGVQMASMMMNMVQAMYTQG
ncbi:YlbE-like family protein [Bacillus sp. FJAT-49736]|uniref:YlbE-like family protein n=1 Tax=Bacillus sp. FJAT-49736 TaxID=2833582 RepID=UPI001BC92676|nr:YlbE-like family protein [Bacillus sp. FJAT-49736]MBS4172396.1 YlbE-like family protein [Bacillus sp. FJAT-49736]